MQLRFAGFRRVAKQNRVIARNISQIFVSDRLLPSVFRLSDNFPFVVAFPFDGHVLNIARSMDNRPTDGERLRVTRVFRNTTVNPLRHDRVGRA